MSLSPDLFPASSSSSGTGHHISDDSPILTLLQSELDHMPHRDYVRRCRDQSIDTTARQDSINWILKVHAHFNFKPVTAILSVNYFDRFLSSKIIPVTRPNRWPFQLLSVACLSLAAKMEEPLVPLLLDLQIFESKYVFEPKTVQRMELLIMSVLNWRLRAVTPFDFLHHFISDLGGDCDCDSDCEGEYFRRLFSTCSDLILSTTRVIDFLEFPPSAIAAAAVLCAAGEWFDSPALNSHLLAANRLEMVRSCHQLIEEYVIDTCRAGLQKQRSLEAELSTPHSPVGVLDAASCSSCDMRLDNPGFTSHEAEPPAKRLRSPASDVQEL